MTQTGGGCPDPKYTVDAGCGSCKELQQRIIAMGEVVEAASKVVERPINDAVLFKLYTTLTRLEALGG